MEERIEMCTQITIRQECPADIDYVYTVVKTAFETAEFSDHDEHNLVNRLRTSDAYIPTLSLVAEWDNQIVGHVLFTEIMVGDGILLALAPVAVIPEMQGKGVGSKLILEGHRLAKKMGYLGCVVLGHHKYYPRFGYQKASVFSIVAPFEVSDECFMAIAFEDNALRTISGVVEYAKEFFE